MTIPNDKIVMVTGDPRSGTSLMMQTLKLLGVPIAGEQFPWQMRIQRRLSNLADGEDKQRLQEEMERHEEQARVKNPKGFYEISGTVIRGLQELGEYGGKAIKIISPGAYPRQTLRGEFGTPIELVHKYILCLRDPRPVAVSQSSLTSRVEVAGIGHGWDNATWKVNATRYMIENGMLAKFIIEQDEDFRLRWLVVDYDDFLLHPETNASQIASYLGLTPTALELANAVANVDISLRRSDDDWDVWPNNVLIEGGIAEQLYAAMQEWALVAMQAVVAEIEQRAEILRLERSRWYDRDVGITVNAWLARELQKKGKLWDTLRDHYQDKLEVGLEPQVSTLFSEPVNAPEYTIDRPLDFGSLTRHMIKYDGQLMSWEAAFVLHQRLWTEGQNTLDHDKLNAELIRLDETE